mmetsp:Transcript_1842/g.5577  ORF Transcript_1842/g.5577 Transcript_1842/m.5577 type:complete len:133 (+) Transcript_1842:3938-4336(+)
MTDEPVQRAFNKQEAAVAPRGANGSKRVLEGGGAKEEATGPGRRLGPSQKEEASKLLSSLAQQVSSTSAIRLDRMLKHFVGQSSSMAEKVRSLCLHLGLRVEEEEAKRLILLTGVGDNGNLVDFVSKLKEGR